MPVDPVEERDVQKFLEMIKEPRIRRALLETLEAEYEERLEEKSQPEDKK